MPEERMQLQDIPVGLLEAHPENSNFMNAERLKKLRRHIEQTGRYEPLVVRPHPLEKGKFQVINGHNRLRVLRALAHQTARCIVWQIDDDQTRLYLTTLNRLSGVDIPERRAVLVENLLASFPSSELALLLPDDRQQLEELERLSRLDLGQETDEAAPEREFQVPVMLSFMLEKQEAKVVNLALDLVLDSRTENPSRSAALTHLARFYLDQHRAVAANE